MSAPSELDFKGNKIRCLEIHKNTRSDGTSNWCRRAMIQKYYRKTSSGLENVKFIKGMVENTLRSDDLPNRIALLRLDTDWYESTKVELEVLCPNLLQENFNHR